MSVFSASSGGLESSVKLASLSGLESVVYIGIFLSLLAIEVKLSVRAGPLEAQYPRAERKQNTVQYYIYTKIPPD